MQVATSFQNLSLRFAKRTVVETVGNFFEAWVLLDPALMLYESSVWQLLLTI